VTVTVPLSERALILAPLGRDSQIALMILNEAGYGGLITSDLGHLCGELEPGAGLLLIAVEALCGPELETLLQYLEQQPAWSDLPIVLLTHHGGSEQGPSSQLSELLGNVTFLERPFHPATLISLISAALRGRRRQYEARDRLIDLSESERRLQSTLETLEQQVEERTAQLRHNEEALRQSQKMEAVGQLTGGIAHDFNNMLTGIIGSLDLMQRYIASGRADEIGRFTDAAVSSANRAAALTHRLLAFSRRQSLDRKTLNVNELIHSLEDLIRRTKGDPIELTLRLADNVWPVSTDVSQLENALLNLVINARDAMPDGGELLIETANVYLDGSDITTLEPVKAGDYLMLAVSDNGTGMTPSVRSKAFDPFFTTKGLGKGTGLGLSMVHGFIEQLGGRFILKSVKGQGTCAELWLPVAADGMATKPLSPRPSMASVPRLSVLVVDDDSLVLTSTSLLLEDLGHRVISATSGAQALELFEQGEVIDLMITDMAMPQMSGAQLAHAVRLLKPDLPIILATGYAERIEGFAAGLPRLSKPFNQLHLVEIIAQSMK